MTFFDRWFGHTAASRNERLIAEKLAEISQIEAAQANDLRTIQRRIDRIDTKMFDLKRQRESVRNELETAKRLNEQRAQQIRAELAELQAQEFLLAQPETPRDRKTQPF